MKPGNYYRSLRNFLERYFLSLQTNGRLRYLSFLWSLAIVFLGFFILVQSNPFYFIIPGMTYPFPRMDSRETVQMYVFSGKEKIVKKINKKIYLSDSIEQNVRNLAFITSGNKELREEAYLVDDVENLPPLGFAVKKVWFYNEKNEGKLIVDLREETINEEMNLFFKDRQFSAQKSRQYFLDAYFETLTRSILSIEKDVKFVIYLVDGDVKSIPGMEYDLSIPHSPVP